MSSAGPGNSADTAGTIASAPAPGTPARSLGSDPSKCDAA